MLASSADGERNILKPALLIVETYTSGNNDVPAGRISKTAAPEPPRDNASDVWSRKVMFDAYTTDVSIQLLALYSSVSAFIYTSCPRATFMYDFTSNRSTLKLTLLVITLPRIFHFVGPAKPLRPAAIEKS